MDCARNAEKYSPIIAGKRWFSPLGEENLLDSVTSGYAPLQRLNFSVALRPALLFAVDRM